jgi:site-specific DNA recombinase
MRDKSEWLPVELPGPLRIVEPSQWQRVQQQLDRNVTFSPRNARHDYLLKGLVTCGGCGSRYVGDPCHGKFYYRCLERCKAYPTVKEEILDSTIWEAIKEAILNPSIIVAQLERLQQHRSESAEQLNRNQGDLDELLEGLKKEEERILEAYRIGVLSPAHLGRELEKLQGRKAVLEASKSKPLNGQNAAQTAPIRRSLNDYSKIAGERLNAFTRPEQKQFLRKLVNEVVFEGRLVRIRGIIPVSEVNPDKKRDATSEAGESLQSEGGIAGTTIYRRDSSSGRTLDTANDHQDRNSLVVPFEISKEVPLRTTIKDQIDIEWMKQHVRENPLITLTELAELVGKTYDMRPSITHLARILRSLGISRIPGSRQRQIAA